jgi:hypothetical protein
MTITQWQAIAVIAIGLALMAGLAWGSTFREYRDEKERADRLQRTIDDYIEVNGTVYTVAFTKDQQTNMNKLANAAVVLSRNGLLPEAVSCNILSVVNPTAPVSYERQRTIREEGQRLLDSSGSNPPMP